MAVTVTKQGNGGGQLATGLQSKRKLVRGLVFGVRSRFWSSSPQVPVSKILAGCPLIILAGAAGYRFHPGWVGERSSLIQILFMDYTNNVLKSINSYSNASTQTI